MWVFIHPLKKGIARFATTHMPVIIGSSKLCPCPKSVLGVMQNLKLVLEKAEINIPQPMREIVPIVTVLMEQGLNISFLTALRKFA